jgi:hypothetical protein
MKHSKTHLGLCLAVIASTTAAMPSMAANLIAYYPFDEIVETAPGSGIWARTPNLVGTWGNAAIPTSGGLPYGLSLVPGMIGNGLQLDMTSAYIQFGTMDPFTIAGTDAFTAAFWLYTPPVIGSGIGSSGFLLSKQQQGATPAAYFRTIIRESNDIQFGVTPDRNTYTVPSQGLPDFNDRWAHVAITGTKSGTTATWQLYFDGVQILNPAANTTTLDPAAVARALRLGAAANNGAQGALDMIFDDVRFYDGVLSQAEILAIIPEPSVMTLLGLGLGGLVLLRLRRR